MNEKSMAGRRIGRTTRVVLALLVMAALPATAHPPAAENQAPAGDVTIGTRHIFRSAFLEGPVPVRIHRPVAGRGDEAPPPALYLLEIADDFAYASTTADFLARCGRIPGLVVVGIDVDKLAGSPRGMIDFLAKELIPFVEKTTGSGPRRILFGHSGRSFAALFMLLEKPDLFEGYICPGMGLTWPLEPGRTDFSAMAVERWAGLATLPKALVFSLGDEKEFFPGVDRFIGVLKNKAPRGLRWIYLQMPGEDHESTKLKTLYQGLEFFFSGVPGAEAIDGHWMGTASIRTSDGQENALSLQATLELRAEGWAGTIGPSADEQFTADRLQVEGRMVSFQAPMPTRIYAFRALLDSSGHLVGALTSEDGQVTGSLRLAKQR